ncbi:MAG: hypothetical protein AAFP26_02030 [Planctomycetota bacterium]
MDPVCLTEFSVYLDQRPGELAGLLGAARAAGVEMQSISTTEHMERGCVRIIGEPVDTLRRVCESLVESGVGPIVEAPVVAIPIDNRPGAVRDIAVLMSDNRINIRYVYLMPARGVNGSAKGDQGEGGNVRCVFRFDDLDKALAVIRDADWPPGAANGAANGNPQPGPADESGSAA